MPSTPDSTSKIFNSPDEKAKNSDEQQKNFKMSGLLIKDKEILSAMEDKIKGIYIPAKDDIEKCENLITLAQYGNIFKYIDQKFISMAQSLFDGNIERNPVKSSFDACQFCDYKTVCGFEKGKKSNNFKKSSNDEILKQIEEDLKNV